MSFAILTDPNNGVLSGTAPDVTYTPDTNFNGADSFTFEVCDAEPLCDTATVSITVNPVNDDPDAIDDTAITNENVALGIAVLDNDTDIDGDTLSVTAVSDPANGVATINPDNTVTYTSDAIFFGEDSFTYDISDGNGGTDTATVTVTVISVNDAPVLDPIGNQSVDEGTTLDVNLSASDVDEDVLSFSLNLDAPSFISLTDNNNGTAVLSIAPTLTDAGNYDITVTVSDGTIGAI